MVSIAEFGLQNSKRVVFGNGPNAFPLAFHQLAKGLMPKKRTLWVVGGSSFSSKPQDSTLSVVLGTHRVRKDRLENCLIFFAGLGSGRKAMQKRKSRAGFVDPQLGGW